MMKTSIPTIWKSTGQEGGAEFKFGIRRQKENGYASLALASGRERQKVCKTIADRLSSIIPDIQTLSCGYVSMSLPTFYQKRGSLLFSDVQISRSQQSGLRILAKLPEIQHDVNVFVGWPPH